MSTTGSHQPARESPPVPTDLQNFQATIESLSSFLPHLENIKKPSRSQNSRIAFIDYTNDWTPLGSWHIRQVDFAQVEQNDAEQFVAALRNEIPSDCASRIIMVEDICYDVIYRLSLAFDLSPDFIEEHLINSGWRGYYGNIEASDWATRRMKKEHTSMKWFRPVHKFYDFEDEDFDYSYNNTLFIKLMEHAYQSETSSRGSLMREISHTFYVSTNICRRPWTFRRDEDATSEGMYSIWEERATIWRRHIDGVLIGVSQRSMYRLSY